MASPSCFVGSGTSNEPVTEEQWAPCGPMNETHHIVPCCNRGSVCYVGGLCESDSSPGTTGWYVSGCTDSNTGDNCPTRCYDSYVVDIKYNYTSRNWNCCGLDDAGYANCSTSSDENFSAPAPSQLVPYYTVPLSGDSTPLAAWSSKTSSSTTLTTPVSSSSSFETQNTTQSTNPAAPVEISPASAKPSSHKLSVSAAAGIGVGTTMAAILAVSVGIVAFIIRRRKRRENETKNTGIPRPDSAEKSVPQLPPVELENNQRLSELPSNKEQPQELFSEREPQELPGGENRWSQLRSD
ncbi:MAG: hypothetical protein M1820_007868 [Bogoriella megaspora]|nr:MAG: hypothetical protein M1820_007868 [Bogoriella megaspora]